MKALRKYLLTGLLTLALATPAAAMQRQWEEVSRMPQPGIEIVTDADDLAISTAEGFVYVAVRRTTNVKIFTILGQMIVQQTLRPGTYRFRLANRGIYLLKTDTLTRRLTL